MNLPRSAGVLMHIASLPGPYGIGTLGQPARDFVDFLVEAGQTYWQILPVGPTGYGDSPYQSFSSFAGNFLFIDPEALHEAGYLSAEGLEAAKCGDDPTRVDYDRLYENRAVMYAQVLPKFRANPPADYAAFCAANADWLEDYALFRAVKDAHGGLPLDKWDEAIRTRNKKAIDMWRVKCAEGVAHYKMLQYFFYTQWAALRQYAANKGIKMIGDLPIYVSGDSADVWANAHLFDLDPDGHPKEVAGCPPDAFSEDGQLWGNPVYDWKALKVGGYRFWVKRLEACMKLYDMVRIDHFRAFASYYCIPYGAENAREGVWREGPGLHFFTTLRKKLGDLPVIAEDLGLLTPDVLQLLEDTALPGMKVLQFAFGGDADNPYLPHHYPKNSVVYTGTHDNDTIEGWLTTADDNTLAHAELYCNAVGADNLRLAMMKTVLSSVSDLCVLTMQDIIGLGTEARTNIPSTLGGNWAWRATADQITADEAAWLRKHTALYGRLPKR